MKNEIPMYDNPTPRCPVVLLIDRSHSMNEVIAGAGAKTGYTYFKDGQECVEVVGGTTRMDELNKGLYKFFQMIAKDEIAKYSVEVKIISFGDTVKHESDFVSFLNITSYKPDTIIPGGETAMGAGLHNALQILQNRKSFYKSQGLSYYQPWLVLMTDGKPTDNWQKSASEAKKLAEQNKLNFFGVGIGQKFDYDCLAQILPAKRPPLELNETKFEEFFVWLSNSLGQVSRSLEHEHIALPSVNGWASLDNNC